VKRSTLKRRAPLKSGKRKPIPMDGNRFCECARCHQDQFCDVHHVLPRGRGGDDHPDNLIRLCRLCHAYVHANPKESLERGWMRVWTHEVPAIQAYRERQRLADLIPDLGDL
jgi:hypothetical protein